MYRFAGFFASPPISPPADLPTGAVWRRISKPFDGIGVFLPDLRQKRPEVTEIESIARALGIWDVDRWLYLTYTCLGGRIDSVYGLACVRLDLIGPVDEDADDRVKAAYLDLMQAFGVPAADAINFGPFRRGYWGDT
jgi:hypothetical protein